MTRRTLLPVWVALFVASLGCFLTWFPMASSGDQMASLMADRMFTNRPPVVSESEQKLMARIRERSIEAGQTRPRSPDPMAPFFRLHLCIMISVGVMAMSAAGITWSLRRVNEASPSPADQKQTDPAPAELRQSPHQSARPAVA